MSWMGKPCQLTIQNLIKISLKIGALTKLGLFFPVLCFIYVFDQTLAEQLYRDKGLWSLICLYCFIYGGGGGGGGIISVSIQINYIGLWVSRFILESFSYVMIFCFAFYVLQCGVHIESAGYTL